MLGARPIVRCHHQAALVLLRRTQPQLRIQSASRHVPSPANASDARSERKLRVFVVERELVAHTARIHRRGLLPARRERFLDVREVRVQLPPHVEPNVVD